MTTLRQLKEQIISDPTHWAIYFMDFVDDFRYYQKLESINDFTRLLMSDGTPS